MNFETDSLYIIIKNDPTLLERVFQGMFIVARHILGYNTPGSVYPFSTYSHWTGYKDFEKDAANFQKKSAITLCEKDYPHKNTKGRDNAAYFTFVTMVNCNESNQNGVIFQALRDAGDINVDAVNTNALAQALFDDYFADMVAYARTSRTYIKGWQSAAA